MTVGRGSLDIHQYWDLEHDSKPRSAAHGEEELIELLDEALRLHFLSMAQEHF
jgi:hypothetical protein